MASSSAATVEVGQTVQSSQTVAKFFIVAADLSQIEIEAAVVESDIGGIDNGDPVVFTVDAFPGERFQGNVVQVRQLGTSRPTSSPTPWWSTRVTRTATAAGHDGRTSR